MSEYGWAEDEVLKGDKSVGDKAKKLYELYHFNAAGHEGENRAKASILVDEHEDELKQLALDEARRDGVQINLGPGLVKSVKIDVGATAAKLVDEHQRGSEKNREKATRFAQTNNDELRELAMADAAEAGIRITNLSSDVVTRVNPETSLDTHGYSQFEKEARKLDSEELKKGYQLEPDETVAFNLPDLKSITESGKLPISESRDHSGKSVAREYDVMRIVVGALDDPEARNEFTISRVFYDSSQGLSDIIIISPEMPQGKQAVNLKERDLLDAGLITERAVMIGRDDQNRAHRFSNKNMWASAVSREHCVVWIDHDKKVYIKNLHPTFGTMVTSEPTP